jgi:hypothetical protein
LTAQTHFQASHGCACPRPLSKIKDTYADRHDLPAHPKRGEVNSACGITISTFRSQVTGFARAGKVLLIAQAGLHKDLRYPDLPNMLDEEKWPGAKQMMRVLLAPLELGRPIAAPPSTPADRVLTTDGDEIPWAIWVSGARKEIADRRPARDGSRNR